MTASVPSQNIYKDLDLGYEINDLLQVDRVNRKIKVITIGAGLTGIAFAQALQLHCEGIDHVMYEQNHDIGGIWLMNRYPGAACDVPSHAYTFNFAPYPDWPRYFSSAEEIWDYLNKVCNVLGLRKYMHFRVEVLSCTWNDPAGIWELKLKETRIDGSIHLFEDECHVLLDASGILKHYKWPKIEGLDRFKGRLIHSARWPKDFKEEQWKNQKFAILGSGASSVQIVPSLQPHAAHLDIFVRSGAWFVSIAGNVGNNFPYTMEEKDRFLHSTEEMITHCKKVEKGVNDIFHAFFRNSEAKKSFEEFFSKRMAEHIKDERILQGLLPKFGLGCRRITPGDPYLEAIQMSNVDVHFTAAERITEHGVVGVDGIERNVDTIVCATGYDVSYRPHFPIIGKEGASLSDQWETNADSYLGIAVPNFPNFFLGVGPNWPIANGSITSPVSAASGYIVQIVEKLQREPSIKALQPRQDAMEEFITHSQMWLKDMVWTDNCSSWYKNPQTGRVQAIWPGSCLQHHVVMNKVRWEDYSIEYNMNKDGSAMNRFNHLGRGFTSASRDQSMDEYPHWRLDAIDPAWSQWIQSRKIM